MTFQLPIDRDQTPAAVADVLFRLKIRDAMSKSLSTAGVDTTLFDVQEIMRTKEISGVPIVADERLLGIVTVHDILSALNNGYIDHAAGMHMSKSLVVLEEDMPLSFAISYFEKYSFRRFPVINKEKKLAGIISSRDILSALIRELNAEIAELEKRIHEDKPPVPDAATHEFALKQLDFENAGHPSYMLKQMLAERGVPRALIRRASVAAYELEMNVVIHSEGGIIRFSVSADQIVIVTEDRGPGIENVDLVFQEGYSTASEWIRTLGFGAGMGIPNARRVSDEFELSSELGRGTKVRSVINIPVEE